MTKAELNTITSWCVDDIFDNMLEGEKENE